MKIPCRTNLPERAEMVRSFSTRCTSEIIISYLFMKNSVKLTRNDTRTEYHARPGFRFTFGDTSHCSSHRSVAHTRASESCALRRVFPSDTPLSPSPLPVTELRKPLHFPNGEEKGKATSLHARATSLSRQTGARKLGAQSDFINRFVESCLVSRSYGALCIYYAE